MPACYHKLVPILVGYKCLFCSKRFPNSYW